MSGGPPGSADAGSLLATAAIGVAALVILGGPTIFTVLHWRANQAAETQCAPQFAPPTVAEPQRAAELADALWETPDDADCLLARYGMTRDGFVTLMEEMAEDEAASIAFAEARKTR